MFTLEELKMLRRLTRKLHSFWIPIFGFLNTQSRMSQGHRLCYKCAAKELAFDPSARVSQSVYITKHWVQGVALGFLGRKRFVKSGKCENFNKIKFVFVRTLEALVFHVHILSTFLTLP